MRKGRLNFMSDNHKLLNNPHKTAAGYAHEIKNPITAVRGLLQLLANPDLPALKRSLYTEIAIEELDRANGLLYEMVHNNPPANRQETTNMKEAITKTTLLFEQAIQSKNLQLETFFAGNFNVQIPKQQLAQVLANILKMPLKQAEQMAGLLLVPTQKDNLALFPLRIMDLVFRQKL